MVNRPQITSASSQRAPYCPVLEHLGETKGSNAAIAEAVNAIAWTTKMLKAINDDAIKNDFLADI